MGRRDRVVAIAAFVGLLAAVSGWPHASAKPRPVARPLAKHEVERAATLFYDKCAGCHGVNRLGSVGKPFVPDLLTKEAAFYRSVIAHGSDAGMPDFGDSKELTPAEIELMIRYIQTEVPTPPEWGLEQALGTWMVLVPPEKRPTRQQNNLDLHNLFSVTLRDAGKIALIDGHSKKIVTTIQTGHAVHISRMSVTGRYLYVMGRDSRVSLVDLWMDPPALVAEVRVGVEGRSVETSKFKGFEDKYAIAGNLWPPQYVIMDGQTLKPLKFVSTRGHITGIQVYHPEPRVASIVASRHNPEFLVCIRDTGKVVAVSYRDFKNLSTVEIDAVPFLGDGGLDATRRYFMVAADYSDKLAVIDTKLDTLVAVIDTGEKPHATRGANFVDPVYGPVWATPHLGDDFVSVVGTDPEGHKEHAWKIVRKLKGPGTGSYGIKTHPKSHNLWVDYGLNPDRQFYQAVAVWDLRDLARPYQHINVARLAGLTEGRVIHGEYNAAGDEIWFSVWAKKTKPSAIVVLDDETRKLKAVIRDPRLITPTGKFNVFNTMNDVY